MTFAPSKVGNFWYRIESALGTSADTWKGIRPDEFPEVPTATRKLIENKISGHRHPTKVDKPIHIELFRENSIKFAQKIRRATTDGQAPSIAAFLQSGGLQAQTSTGDTTCEADTTVSLIKQTGNIGGIGQAILVEKTSGLYVPALISGLSTNDATLSMALSAAPAEGNAVEQMTTMSLVTDTTFQVPADKTLQFRLNTWGKYDDALGDLAYIFEGCALAEFGEIEIGLPGTMPTISLGFHCGKVDVSANDIGADSYQDTAPAAVITDDFEFCFANASSGGAIARVSKYVKSAKVNFGYAVVPIPCTGGSFAGLQGYMLTPTAPIITVTALWQADSDFEATFLSELEDDNTSKYIHLIQPTRSLDSPAFGIWAPNCHLKADAEPVINPKGDNLIEVTATFEADLSGYNSETDIDEDGSPSLFFAVSGESQVE